jgi:hypothetical protein
MGAIAFMTVVPAKRLLQVAPDAADAYLVLGAAN